MVPNTSIQMLAIRCYGLAHLHRQPNLISNKKQDYILFWCSACRYSLHSWRCSIGEGLCFRYLRLSCAMKNNGVTLHRIDFRQMPKYVLKRRYSSSSSPFIENEGLWKGRVRALTLRSHHLAKYVSQRAYHSLSSTVGLSCLGKDRLPY